MINRRAVLGILGSAFALVAARMPRRLPWPRDWFVSMKGRDSNPGTESAPMASIGEVMKKVQPGDRIYIQSGTYRIASAVGFKDNLTDGARGDS